MSKAPDHDWSGAFGWCSRQDSNLRHPLQERGEATAALTCKTATWAERGIKHLLAPPFPVAPRWIWHGYGAGSF
ncbi:hypothetical protein GCM10022207_08620 [Streptomyces lannensis]|uniref:Uncharacterized protein n=1 Tax=Streptomyces lannensis TaxID=766498 RepID=A0ABP7JMY1_9ACTN